MGVTEQTDTVKEGPPPPGRRWEPRGSVSDSAFIGGPENGQRGTWTEKVTESQCVLPDVPSVWQNPGHRTTLLDVGENNLGDAKDLAFGPHLSKVG